MSFLEELTKFGKRVGAFYLHGCPTIDVYVSDEIYVMLLGEMSAMAESLGREADINRGYLSVSIDVHCGGVNFKIRRREQVKSDNGGNQYEPMLRYFDKGALGVSGTDKTGITKSYFSMALSIVRVMEKSEERTAALRKLLESMDCVLRSFE